MIPLDPWSEAVKTVGELVRRGKDSLSHNDENLLAEDLPEPAVQWIGGVRELAGVPDSLFVHVEVRSGDLPDFETRRIETLARAAYLGFFDAATDGLPLTATSAIRAWFGSDLHSNYPEANDTFLRFATTYWTLKALIRELQVIRPDALLTQLMKFVDGEIFPLFFPSDDPLVIDPLGRTRDQERFLRAFAPRMNVGSFLSGNPIILRDRKRVAQGFPVIDPALASLGDLEPCRGCQNRPVTSWLQLPDGRRLNVCDDCKTALDPIFQEPLRSVEFAGIVDTMKVSRDGVFGIPWGAAEDVAIASLKGRPLGSGNESLSVEGRSGRAEFKVTLKFTGNESGLDEVWVSPRKAVLDAQSPLKERFGEPKVQYPLGREHHSVWVSDGFEVLLDETDVKTVGLGFRTPRLRL